MKTFRTYEFGDPDSDIVLIQPVDDHDLEGIGKEFATIIKSCKMGFRLIAVRIDDWNNVEKKKHAIPLWRQWATGYAKCMLC